MFENHDLLPFPQMYGVIPILQERKMRIQEKKEKERTQITEQSLVA